MFHRLQALTITTIAVEANAIGALLFGGVDQWPRRT
jgi:hypothetical protein